MAPSAAVVTLLILFFLFLPNSEQQIEDPLMSDPPAINYNTDKEPVPSSISEPGSSDSRLRQNENNTMNREGQTFLNQDYKVVVRPNDVVVKEKANYPIFRNQSVKLDDYISGNNQRNNNLMQGNVVRSGEDEFDFEGFLLRQQPDQRTIQKYRDMIDSVKRAQAKADSIKKASK